MRALWFLIIVTLLAQPLGVASQSEQDVCRPGWILVSHTEVLYCVLVGTSSTWSQASDVCQGHGGALYSHNDNYLVNGEIPFASYLISNGINHTWTGLYVQDGKLLEETLNNPGVKTPTATIIWSADQPLDDHKCAATSLSLGFLFPPGEGSGMTTEARRKKREVEFPGFLHNTSGLSLIDCEYQLPFACVADILQFVTLQKVSICPNDTLGSYSLDTCYFLSETQVSYWDAKDECYNKGGQLAEASSSFYRRIAHNAIINFMELRGSFESGPVSGNTWVNGTLGCSVIDTTTSGARHNWDCNVPLKYLCEIPAVYPDPIVMEITTSKFRTKRNIAPQGDFEVFITEEDLFGESSDGAALICTVEGYNPDIHQVAWYKNGVVVLSWLYNVINGSVYLDLNQRLLGRESQVEIVGYYWCEVKTKRDVVTSSRAFVRITDMELYAGSIETKEDTRDIPSMYSLFNLRGTLAGGVILTIRSIGAQEETAFPLFTTVQRFRENGTFMDFLSYRDVFFREGFAEAETLSTARESLVLDFSSDSALVYFKPNTLQVRNIDFCLAFEHVEETTGDRYSIPQTETGYTYETKALCGVDKEPIASIDCLGDKWYGAYWGEFELNSACDFSDIEESDVSNTLKNLSQIEVTDDNVEEVLDSVISLTENTTLTDLDLLYTTAILENAANVTSMTPKVADEVLEVYNKILESSDEALSEMQQRGKVANRVLNVMDTVGEKLEGIPQGYQRYVTDTYGNEVWDLQDAADLVVGLQFTETGYQPILKNDSMVTLYSDTTLKYGDTVAAIFFPEDFIQQLVNDAGSKAIRISMQIYKDTRLFRLSENSSGVPTEYVLNSKIISAKILVDNQPITSLDGNFVTTVFMPNKTIPGALRMNLTACGYWNFTGNDDTGSWSKDGCRYERTEEGRDVCICDHLTNFAVLLDFYGQSTLPPEHALPLSIITIIGLGLSIIGLSLTVLSFVTFKKLRQTRPQQTLFNLALAELCSWIVFLAGINQTQDHVGCIVVAALIHYFIMASFMWMLMEAVLHYLMFVKVLGTYFTNYMLKTTIPAWGLPLLPVVVILAVDVNLYRGGESYCWMSLNPFYFGFALPVGLIILANIVIYIMVVVSICRRSKRTGQTSQSDRSQYIVNIRAAFFCFVLLGLSWVFGYLTLSTARVVFQYIFTVSCTLQGFLIFILFTARDKKVRDSWRNLCCKRKQGAPSSGKPHSDNLPLHKSSSNDSHGSNTRSHLTHVSNGAYDDGVIQQFDNLGRISRYR